MSTKLIREDAAEQEHPIAPYLRMERIPHIWCPTCGIGTVVKCYATALEKSGLDLDKVCIVSGIGCTGRVAGYMRLDGFHATHGRAVPFATDLARFLEALALQKETDNYDPRADRVALMTLHAAKGLEFPVVFITGCEEGLLPYQRGQEPSDIEEERRLFYVGMTRARQKLILTHAKSRYLFGQQHENRPSRFVEDIEQTLMDIEKAERRKPGNKTPEHPQLRLF